MVENDAADSRNWCHSKVEQDTSSQISSIDTLGLGNESSLNTNVGENTE